MIAKRSKTNGKPPSRETSETDRVMAQMNEALLLKFKAILRVYEQTQLKQNQSTYELAMLIHEVKHGDANAYGSNAISKIAAGMGLSKSKLYDYASIAETWARDEYDMLMDRRDYYGKPLATSHLIELARVASTPGRDELLDKWSEQGLSVKGLARAAREQRGRLDQDAGSSATSAINVAVNKIVTDNDAQAATFDELVFCIEGAPAGAIDAGFVKRLDSVRAEVESQYAIRIETLKRCLELATSCESKGDKVAPG